MSERNPLTLEELRNAYDFSKRVGLHVLIQFDSCKCEYEGVIDHRDDDGICAVYAASGEWLKEKDYGKTWVAYDAEPPRLDRSAWEPCEHCKPSKNPLDRWGGGRINFRLTGTKSTSTTPTTVGKARKSTSALGALAH